ncbi:HAD-hydrolase yfnB [Listeria floridensis FSL S10-1187]|uniref:HAD-hydrolase yfnB n=1 Tax=Listeria floridensis FSL S10-1187 TaxID=1265817 RepID=A0ABN0RBU1_9LIST|nr:YjjG family noncanonical pyrimidine nucleotidase [Listeria floridensis]EUJ25737.1 HAD-hydrolase yfnB [Listeria floridensis FSL S10-1187]
MGYQTLLFDVDDTLLDFKAAEDDALKRLFQSEKIDATPSLVSAYKVLNAGLWQDFERGIISRDEILNTRFARVFAEFGKKVDGVLMEARYREFLEDGHELIDGAKPLIETLYQKHDLYIVTNGVSKTQYRRLRDSGMDQYFQGIFVSEDTGYQKPMPEYFEYCFERIPGFALEKSLIIGDSLSSDIRGANLVGLDSCWFNPHGLTNQSANNPTFEINNLSALAAIVEK